MAPVGPADGCAERREDDGVGGRFGEHGLEAPRDGRHDGGLVSRRG
jgi:hypothetical protein